MFRYRRLAGLGFLWLSVASASLVIVDLWGWSEIPGGSFALIAMGPLVATGAILLNSARYAEGEARREAHQRSSSSS